jgi:Putative metallopeptidase
MKPSVRATTIAFLLICPFVAVSPTPAQEQPAKGNITIEYGPSTAFPAIAAGVKQRMVLEELQHFLTPLRLPKDLKITAMDCGAPVVTYTSGGPVTICYDAINQVVEQAKKIYPQDADLRTMVITGATIEVALHETAHAIFDILQVPIWGREDDAADRLSAMLMLQFGEDMERITIKGTAEYFRSLADSEKAWSGSDYANRASPNAQRYFNYLCIATAADPKVFGGAIIHGIIPPFRASDCAHEYQQVVIAFYMRIMPFVDADAMVRVRATQWMNWTPGK